MQRAVERNRINLSLPLQFFFFFEHISGLSWLSLVIQFSNHYLILCYRSQHRETIPTLLATLKVSLRSHLPATTAHMTYPVSEHGSALRVSRMKGREGLCSFAATWQRKIAKAILWSSLQLWPYWFLSPCQQSTCWKRGTHLKRNKTENQDLTFPIQTILPCQFVWAPSLQCQKTPKPRTFYFTGRAFPNYLQLTCRIEAPALQTQCLQSPFSISPLQNQLCRSISCVPEAFCEYNITALEMPNHWGCRLLPGTKPAPPHSLKMWGQQEKHSTGEAIFHYIENFCFQLRSLPQQKHAISNTSYRYC